MSGGASVLGGLASGLVEGFAGRKEEQRQRKLQLSDDERNLALADHNATIKTIQGNMQGAYAKIHSGDMSGHDELASLNNQLSQVQADRTALFHPDQGPGALAHLGQMVWEKIHGKTAPPMQQNQATTAPMVLPGNASGNVNAPATPEIPAAPSLPSQRATAAPAPATPATPAVSLPPMQGKPTVLPAQAAPVISHPVANTPADLKARAAQDLSYGVPMAPANPMLVHRQQLAQVFPSEQVEQAMEIFYGLHAKPTSANLHSQQWKPEYGTSKATGEPAVMYHSEFSNKRANSSGDDPTPEEIADFVPTPRGAGAGGAAPKIGTLGAFLTEAYGPHPTAQQTIEGKRLWQPGSNTTGERTIMVPQPDGSIKAYTVQSTSSRTPGGPSPNSIPNRQADATQPAASPATTPAASPHAPVAPPGSSKPSPAAPRPTASTAEPTAGVLKAKVKAASTPSKAGVVQSGDIVGGKMTAPEVIAKKTVDTAESSYLDVQKAYNSPDPLSDQGIILAWLRGRVNRVTQSEIASVTNLGGATMKLQNGITRIISGKMSDQQRVWFLKSAKENYDIAKTVYSKYSSSPATGQVTDEEFLRNF